MRVIQFKSSILYVFVLVVIGSFFISSVSGNAIDTWDSGGTTCEIISISSYPVNDFYPQFMVIGPYSRLFYDRGFRPIPNTDNPFSASRDPSGDSELRPLTTHQKVCSQYDAFNPQIFITPISFSHVGVLNTTYNHLGRICMFNQLEGDYFINASVRGYGSVTTGMTTMMCGFDDPIHVTWDGHEDWCLNCGRGLRSSQEISFTGVKLDPRAQGYIYDDTGEGHCCSPRAMNLDKDYYDGYNDDEVWNEEILKLRGPSFPSSILYTNQNCGKIVSTGGSQNLCFYNRNPQFESVPEGAWFNASDLSGSIIYMGCNVTSANSDQGHEYVAAEDKWYRCSDGGFVVDLDDSDSVNTLRITGQTAFGESGQEITNDFLCDSRFAPHHQSVLECSTNSNTGLNPPTSSSLKRTYAGTLSNQIRGGLVVRGGVSARTVDNIYYTCGNDSRWLTDLDSLEKAGERGVYCDDLHWPSDSVGGRGDRVDGVGWTGSYCCGDFDDRTYNASGDFVFNVTHEYYVDPDADPDNFGTNLRFGGACFNSIAQQNNQFLTIYDKDGNSKQVTEVLVVNGTFQGCAINASWALEQYNEDLSIDYEKQPLLHNDSYFFGGSFKGNSSDFGEGPEPSKFGYTGYDGRGNEFLLDLRSNPNSTRDDDAGDPLIKDNTYCSQISTNQDYFCSYLEKWLSVTNQRGGSHLSFIPWYNDSVQQGECCPENYCWNGDRCIRSLSESQNLIESFHEMNEMGDGFLCVDGGWEWRYQKESPYGQNRGHCLEESQCYIGGSDMINTLGPLHYPIDILRDKGSTPRCIDDGEFYNDFYCGNGTWQSRTSFVAAELYHVADEKGNLDNMVLHCDHYGAVSPYANYYIDRNTNIQTAFLSANDDGCYGYRGGRIGPVPCTNNVCVLVMNEGTSDQEVLFGMSLNYRVNRTLSYGDTRNFNFGRIFGLGSSSPPRLDDCKSFELSSDVLHQCAGQNIYYHGNKGYVIFSESNIAHSDTLVSVFRALFTNFIATFAKLFVSDEHADDSSYKIFSSLFNNLGASLEIEGLGIDTQFECTYPDCSYDDKELTAENVRGADSIPSRIPLLNTLYINKKGDLGAFGLVEYRYIPVDNIRRSAVYSGMQYTGFSDENLCELALDLTNYRCRYVGDDSYIITREVVHRPVGDYNAFDQWVFLGPALRLQSS